mmetsp:Transcript_25512/g.33832  ORF Transcript_25512/g.33832 Transcript_25512/m.33832 type:complete len:272 (+) Transcript_25512:94-909(+)
MLQVAFSYYELFRDLFGGDDRLFIVSIVWIAYTIPLLLVQIFLIVIYQFDFLAKYKLQEDENIDSNMVRKCLKYTLVQHFITVPCYLYFVGYKTVFIICDLGPLDSPAWMVLTQLCVWMLIEDTIFYWSHRLLHTPTFYKIHKVHHENHNLTALSIAGEYSHPAESILGNYLPSLFGPCVFRGHFFTLCVWIIIRCLKFCDAHCGYDFPFSPFGVYPMNSAARHGFHHSANMGSFGSFTVFWDTVCGTDNHFEKAQSSKRGTLQKRKKIDS